jgi:hypothetical protein
VPPGDPFSRRRYFHGVGRYPGTLRHVTAELNPEGTDYLMLADALPEGFAPVLDLVRQLLSQDPAPLTRQETLARWPRAKPPRADSLWRTLTHACKLGILVRTGEGTKTDAFRYGLAQRPASA